MSDIRFRAITTRYKGYAFRSRLEARWAVFFDHLGIRWEYEPEGFELGNGLRYLPDFWLPDWGLWVEVKPGEPDDVARTKASRLAMQLDVPVLIARGMPDTWSVFYYPNALVVDEYHARAPWSERTIYVQGPAPAMECPSFEVYDMSVLDPALYGPAADALMAARSARFEHGQEGAI